MRRLGREVWVATVLLVASLFFLAHLLTTSSGGGAFVSTATLPTAVAATMALLAAILLGWSLCCPAAPGRIEPAEAETKDPALRGRWRVFALIGWTALEIGLMPWFGYVITTAIYIAGLALLFGSRRPLPILAMAVLVPMALLLFFERFMIVLLPSARLFD